MGRRFFDSRLAVEWLAQQSITPEDVANALALHDSGSWYDRARATAYDLAGSRRPETYRMVYRLCCSILGQHGGNKTGRITKEHGYAYRKREAEQLSLFGR